jgi:hypothetical protein
MPINPPGVVAALIPALISGGMIGPATPKLALGLAIGVSTWVGQIQIVTVDVGTLGVGVGLLPLVVPPPPLLAALLLNLPAAGVLGIMMPPMAVGLSIGLSASFAQGILSTIHPTVGTGAATAKLIPPQPLPFIQAGLKSVDITGSSSVNLATGISNALFVTFLALTFPVPIVGAPSISPSGGVGTGKIL